LLAYRSGPQLDSVVMRRKLQWLLVSRLAIACALLIAVGLVERNHTDRTFVPVLGAMTAITVVLSAGYYLALRSRLPQLAQAYAQLLVDVAIVTWLVYRTGDVESPFLALYLVTIFAGCALLGRSGVSLLGAASGGLYCVVGILTMMHVL